MRGCQRRSFIHAWRGSTQRHRLRALIDAVEPRHAWLPTPMSFIHAWRGSTQRRRLRVLIDAVEPRHAWLPPPMSFIHAWRGSTQRHRLRALIDAVEPRHAWLPTPMSFIHAWRGSTQRHRLRALIDAVEPRHAWLPPPMSLHPRMAWIYSGACQIRCHIAASRRPASRARGRAAVIHSHLLGRYRPPLPVGLLSHHEVEGVVRLQPHAQVTQHQPAVHHLRPHETSVEPLQPLHGGNCRRFAQCLHVGRTALELHRPMVGQQRAVSHRVAAGCHRHHPPQQGVERHRHREARRIAQAHRGQALLRGPIDLRLGDQPQPR